MEGMAATAFLRFVLAAAAGMAALAAAAQDFPLTIIHTNDIHSHAEPSRVRDVMLGGFARQSGLIQKLRAESKNPIVLNAGDSFQGTIYFNVYEGMAEAAFMNLAGFQAMAVGNHEFDKGPGPLGKFIDQVSFPVLAANLDVSAEPALKDKVKPSTIIMAGGQKIGVVGAITPDTPSISSPGPTVKFLNLLSSVQKEVDLLIAQGINKVVLLSHLGYGDDLRLARQLRGVDVVVGGHSHTLLGRLTVPGFDRTDGEYPTMVTGADSGRTLVVQAWEWGKVVGKLEVVFDPEGRVKSWSGRPHQVDETAPIDKRAASLVAALRKPVESLISQMVGETAEALPRTTDEGDNLMGYVVADAQLAYLKDKGAVAAFMNRGGVRRDLPKGKVSYGDLIEVQPFTNTLVLIDLTGAEIKAMLEHGVMGSVERGPVIIPSAGAWYRFDTSKPEGQRVVEAVVGGAPLDPAKTYRVVVNSFMAGGGDGLVMLRDSAGARTDTGFVDVDSLVAYFKSAQPLAVTERNRMRRG